MLANHSETDLTLRRDAVDDGSNDEEEEDSDDDEFDGFDMEKGWLWSKERVNQEMENLLRGTLGRVQEKVVDSIAELLWSKKKQHSSNGSAPLLIQRNVEQLDRSRRGKSRGGPTFETHSKISW